MRSAAFSTSSLTLCLRVFLKWKDPMRKGIGQITCNDMLIELSLDRKSILRYISLRDARRHVMEGRRQSALAAIKLLGRVSCISVRLKTKTLFQNATLER
jgi:hypothetical protein